jgi:RNA polymerase sigma factor (sigma-70 family)
VKAGLPDTAARDLRTLYDAGTLGNLTDAQLLDRFLADRDADAFATLVDRHARLVWGVCRRMLQSHHDAEDAFQATFLVLARKAASVVPRERLPNWLYGVAYLTARKARARSAQRQRREKPVAVLPEPQARMPNAPDERLTLLDRELYHLPEKYRAPIVLCELNGLSHEEAARRIGCPVGTLSARLSRGRALLGRRLGRRGAALSAPALTALLAPDTSAATMSPSLTAPIAKAAIQFASRQPALHAHISSDIADLAQEVIRTMLIAKLKTACTVIAFATILISSAVVLAHSIPRFSGAIVPNNSTALHGAQDPAQNAADADKKGPILAGSIRDVQGRPVPGAEIVLYSGFATRMQGQSATTDRDGRYRFDPLKTGSMTKAASAGPWDLYVGMRVKHPNHVSADGKSWWDITVPNADRRVHVHDFRMVRGGKLAGQLLDPKSNTPLAGVDIRIQSPSPRNVKFHVYATTDAAGRFTSEALFPGEYVVDINSPELGYPVLGNATIAADQTKEERFSFDELSLLVARAVGAHSGSMRLGWIKAVTATTQDRQTGEKLITTKQFIQLPDRFRFESRVDGDDKTLICILTEAGFKRWHKHDDGTVREVIFGGLERPPEYWHDSIKFFGPRAVLRLQDADYTLALLERTLVDSRPAFGFRVTKTAPTVKVDLRMFFDQEHGRLVKQENLLDGTESRFLNYEEIHAVPVARTTIITSKSGKAVVEQKLLEFESQQSLDAALFQKP